MPKFTVPFDEPRADLLLLTRFENCMRERARRAGGARAHLEKLTRDMGEIFGFKDKKQIMSTLGYVL